MVNNVDVSVLIVNWNTREVTCECLESVYDQTQGIAFEVILIDNASSDGSADAIRCRYPEVKLIENKENLGFAAANNQGIKSAQGRYVLLLNPDTVIQEGAIDKTVAFMDKQSEAGVVGIRNYNADGSLARNCFQFASVQNLMITTLGLHSLFPKNRYFGRERLSWWDYQTIREVDVVAGCYMLVRREAIDQVGIMDEAYFMYGEEMDWCWRFKRAGWKTLYYPEARIIHYGGMSAAQNPLGMHVEQRKSFLRFIEKRQGRIAKKTARLLMYFSGVIRLGYWGIRWLVSSGMARETSVANLQRAVASTFKK